MRLVTFRQGAESHVGVLQGQNVLPVGGQKRMTMLDLIEANDEEVIYDLVSLSQPIPLQEVEIRAPIPRPHQNIICLGRNYREHADEMQRAGRDALTAPTFFTKAVTSVIGPYDEIPFDSAITSELDWEVELAVVIGSRARNVAAGDALRCVFGYSVLNDISARDLQYGHGGQFFYGKSLDGSCPIGPCIVTADEIPDPHNLPISLRVNGETKQSSNTSSMILDVAGIIEQLSLVMTLLPGQMIATGTPPGVGYAREPKEFLQPGDVMESEIEGIGVLRNVVGADDALPRG
jgi:2-keto-4-pentenoate hydratase/2-oxohepta-3-ene-1,7-dioic acid hydratase in catechol pathway